METVGIGVIGCGAIGGVHMNSASKYPNIKLLACADLRKESSDAKAQQYNIPNVYTSPDELFENKEIEGVVLALPTGGRAEVALRALAKGKHVLLEKPAALNLKELEAIKEAKGDLIVGCCSARYQFLESTDVLKQIVTEGKLGKIRSINIRCIQAAGPAPANTPPVWRVNKALNGGGIFANWGPYDMDYIFSILGWHIKPELVMARSWHVADHLSARVAPGSDAETHLTAYVYCEDDISISYERAEFSSSVEELSWRIVGEKGTLLLKMAYGDNEPHTQILAVADSETGVKSEIVFGKAESNEDQHFGPVRDFAMAIRENRPTKTSLEQAMIVQKLMDRIYESADSKKPIEY